MEMLQRIESAIQHRALQLLRMEEELRLAQDEAAREALRLKEAQMQRLQEKLRCIGRCPMNFQWIPEGSGYRCAGGSHFVSKSQVNFADEVIA